MKHVVLILAALFCTQIPTLPTQADATKLVEVATSSQLWNGVAVSPQGRIFASFPRWLGDSTMSVGEVLKDGSVRAFPGGNWNQWSPQFSPQQRFVNVNSVVADDRNNLWVVDSAAPRFGRVVSGGAKLVQIDLATNWVKRVYHLNAQIAPEKSYVNDVRVGNGYAYLTESGLGAIIILNLQSGQARRLLANHPATKSDRTIVPTIGGREFRNAKGQVPQIHANDIELSPDGAWLYFQPTYGPNLLRIRTEDLHNASLSETELGDRVEVVAPSKPLGGMTMDSKGILYLSDLENNAIVILCPDGRVKQLVQDARIQWADASSLAPDGNLYFPAAQVHRMPMFNGGVDGTERPFRLFRVSTSGKQCSLFPSHN